MGRWLEEKEEEKEELTALISHVFRGVTVGALARTLPLLAHCICCTHKLTYAESQAHTKHTQINKRNKTPPPLFLPPGEGRVAPAGAPYFVGPPTESGDRQKARSNDERAS